ncbi:MAG: ATP-dependent sacrificial sulfur transferase LarE [Pseudomonadales bacterium]|jgi:uncharacterized protein|nr:ATP-dependent sacrificial sulfur transferase LarE [Pseudomonadales bacterium]
MDAELASKYQALQDTIRSYSRVIVAFSGGIDSSLVAFVAGQVLGENALAVTSGSASLKRTDLELSKKLGDDWGIAHQVIVTDELSKSDYRANPTNRCFYCKTSLYTELAQIASAQNYAFVLNGTNLDDLGDHRPGLIAADDYNVKSPLVEAGFHKADIRALAHELGLENADKPQAACLSSRFPYGTAIDQILLAQVEAAEDVLADVGFSQYRVRHHGEVARLEILPEEFPLAIRHHADIEKRIKDLGYRFIAMDMGGFRSGSLNEGLQPEQIQVVNIHSPH